MKQEFRIFLRALQYFTRIPVPARIGRPADQLGQTARYLPLIGVIVGALAAALMWLAAHLLPQGIAVTLGIVAGILLTGAFHEDGLSNFADGLRATGKQQALTIMNESRVGAYGVIATVLVLLLKYQVLLALAGTHSMAYAAFALLAGHAFSRALAVSIMATLPYARSNAGARATSAAQPATREFALRAAAVAVPVTLVALGILIAAHVQFHSLLAAVAIALIVRVYLAWQFAQRLGGYTGDCVGAVQQLTELGFYLGLLASV